MVKKKSTAIVVYKNAALQKPKTRKRKKLASKQKLPAAITADPEARRYFRALSDPFNEGACGARVVDQYGTHTTTYELRATHTMVAGASGSIGVWVLPNVVTSLVVPNGTFNGSQTITWLDNTTTGSTYRWGFDAATLGARLQNYRIVGMGVRVTNLSSMTASQGKFIMGSYPINAYYVTKDFTVGGAAPPTNAGGTQANTYSKWGIPWTGTAVDYAGLVNYPGTRVLSALEVGENEFDIIPRPCQPCAFDFREPFDSYQGFGYTSATSVGDPSYLRLDGFEACFVALVGGVNNTSSIDLEIVYHIEGAPVIAAGTGVGPPTNAFVNQQGTQSPINMNGFHAAVETALAMPAVRKVVHVGADMIHPLLGKVARAII